MYDPKTCKCEEAAWLITTTTPESAECAFFETHITEDEYSPNGYGWYFSSFMKGKDGTWSEYDGGIYWDYQDANEMEDVIGSTIPFKEFSCVRIDHETFDVICFRNDSQREIKLFSELGIAPPQKTVKEKSYVVMITETLQRAVPVKATSRDDALERARDGWKREVHVLSGDDFKDVSFRVAGHYRDKGSER